MFWLTNNLFAAMCFNQVLRILSIKLNLYIKSKLGSATLVLMFLTDNNLSLALKCIHMKQYVNTTQYMPLN